MAKPIQGAQFKIVSSNEQTQAGPTKGELAEGRLDAHDTRSQIKVLLSNEADFLQEMLLEGHDWYEIKSL